VVLNDSCRLGLVLQLNQSRLLRISSVDDTKGNEAASSNSNDDKKPSSKVEESVKAIKTDLQAKQPPPKRSIWKRIEDEVRYHYQ
jgi:hypothetical protein